MLLMIGNLYANREPVSYGTVARIPYSYEYLISLYRNYAPDVKEENNCCNCKC